MTTPAEAIAILNEINRLDPTVLPALIAFRVTCNEALAKHPTVQVGHKDNDPAAGYEVGLLGIINGLFGVQTDGVHEGWGHIYMHLPEGAVDGPILKFSPRTDDGFDLDAAKHVSKSIEQ